MQRKKSTRVVEASPLQRRAAIWLIAMAMVFAGAIAIVDLFFGFYVVSAVLGTTVLGFGMLLRQVMRGGSPGWAFAVTLAVGLPAVFLPALTHEPTESLLWCVTYPPFLVFFYGLRNGLRYTAALFVLMVAFMFFVNPSQIGVTSVGMVMAYLLVTVASFFYEHARLATMADLESLMNTDELTGLSNRRQMDSLMGVELAALNEDATALSVLAIDVDDFKQVNDTFGHPGGDDFLMALAEHLREATPSTCHLARIGGDEFQIVAPGMFLEEAAELAEGLRTGVAGARWLSCGPITISVGVAEAGAGESRRSLFRRADRHLYRAKGAGKNRVNADA